MDIYDSPFDDTFTGGEPLVLRTGATGKRTAYGTQSRYSTVSLANGEYWTGESYSQTVMTGRSMWSDWPEFSHLALTLAKDDKQWIGGGGFNYVLETADLTTAEIFA